MKRLPIPKKWYTATYDNTTTQKIGEMDIVFPDMPPVGQMVNGIKKSKDQYFRSLSLPDFSSWDALDIDRYVEWQFHRRKNGEWQMINGQPFYIPGGCIPFFEHWTNKSGVVPSFRVEAIHFFWQWYLYIEPDPNLFGMFDLKPRRIGDTEKSLYITWERVTRYKNCHAGLQSYTDAEAAKNFKRLAKAHKSMPWFFKPNRSGSDREYLSFESPSEVRTKKKLEEDLLKTQQEMASKDNLQFLGSSVTYESTVTGKYDGDELHFYHLDEVFKIDPSRLNVKVQWKNARKFLSFNNEETIVGKAILSSTVEKRGKDDPSIEGSIEMANYLWYNSDPNERDEFGRTYTGLARVFRDFTYTAKVDAYGFHERENAIKRRDAKLKKYREKGDMKSVTDEYRKAPASPEEALSDVSDECILHPELCEERLYQLKTGKGRHGKGETVCNVVEGDLVWKNGEIKGEVIWIPRRGGKWHISQQPTRPNNVAVEYSEGTPFFKPMNMGAYRMGVDPFDSGSIEGRGSDGAFTVKRRFDLRAEVNELKFTEDGEDVENAEVMLTNKYICDYTYRHKNPYDFYDDVMKTCWYFGIACFPEIDKPGLVNWAVSKGMKNFLQLEPTAMLNASNRRKLKRGTKASTETISQYVDQLSHYIYYYVWNCEHKRILENWKNFTVKKRTKFDLTVATGFTELADMSKRYRDEDEDEELWGEDLY